MNVLAKLEDVKVVNENIVEYNGFVYELVTDEGNIGDLIQCFEYEYKDLTFEAFYEVKGVTRYNEMEFFDDVDVDRFRSCIDEDWKVFRKSQAITNDKLNDAEGVVKIELPDGTKLEGTPSDLEKITRSMQALQAEQVASEEPVEIEDKQALLKEGDCVRVISNESNHRFEIGTIVKLSPFDEYKFKAYYLDESDFWYVYRKDLEPLTEEETEHIVREAEEEKKVKVECAKWAAIGRGVGELRNGDVIKFNQDTGAAEFSEGSVVIITNVNGEDFNFGEYNEYDGDSTWAELIVPVEQRFDTVG